MVDAGSKWNQSDFPFPVDYNDCFETPLQAYQDVQPLIDWLATGQASSANNNSGHGSPPPLPDDSASASAVGLYDPYFCNGRTAVLLREHLGYTNVVHEKRDFYADIRDGTVPAHDILITNPPYSDTHKTKCLDFCFRRLKSSNIPFLLLMPAYTASKNYYRSFLKDGINDDQVIYIVPGQDYQYAHPDNTGKEESPFASLWFCGIGRQRAKSLRSFLNTNDSPCWPCSIAYSLADLDSTKVVSLQNRPNPRQRRKRRRTLVRAEDEKELDEVAASGSEQPEPLAESDSHPSQQTTKKSKYRNPSGKRTKKRF